MDPNLFFLDMERLFEVLVMIVVLSFFVERALAPLFGSRFYITHASGKSYKELIAFVLSGAICWYWQFDAFSIVLTRQEISPIGSIITGAIIAGGSKASLKLFRDVLKFRSIAEQTRLKPIDELTRGRDTQ